MSSIGPQLPPGMCMPEPDSDSEIVGPALPPGFKAPSVNTDTSDSDSSSDSDSGTTRKRAGPDLPAHLAKRTRVENDTDDSVDNDEDDDDDVIGPLPPSATDQPLTSAATEFEMRAKKMKDKLLNANVEKPKERESWMMELPPTLVKNFPLENRTFSRKAVSVEQDSSWTDTPNAPKKKKDDKKEKLVVASRRDQEMAEQVQQYNEKHREKTLLELHGKPEDTKKKKKEKKAKKEKKRKKDKKDKKDKKEKKDKKKDKNERRPFDRDEDLNVNKFDDAKRKLLIKKSAVLNTRFGHGSQQFI